MIICLSYRPEQYDSRYRENVTTADLKIHAAETPELMADWLLKRVQDHGYTGGHEVLYSNIIVQSFEELAELADQSILDGAGEDSIFYRGAYEETDERMTERENILKLLYHYVIAGLGDKSQDAARKRKEAQQRKYDEEQRAKRQAEKREWEAQAPEREAKAARDKEELERRERSELLRLARKYPNTVIL